MKKILVTGATGFIGNYVITALLNSGLEVIATSSSEARARMAPWYSKVRYIPFDLKEYNNSINYMSFFNEPDAVIHLAWEGLPNYKEGFHMKENLPRHLIFLGNMIRNGLSDLTVTGTCLEYGMQEGELSEDMAADPKNAYAEAKDQLRQQLEALSTEIPFSLKWARLFYMYGKGQNSKSLISQLEVALTNNEETFNMSGGEQVRDFLPVEKVAEYIAAIAMQKKVTGIINCCSAKPISVKSFVENYVKGKNKKISLNLGYYSYTDYEPMRFWGNDNKLKSIGSND